MEERKYKVARSHRKPHQRGKHELRLGLGISDEGEKKNRSEVGGRIAGLKIMTRVKKFQKA